ncbi:hypothetical protein ACOME3_006573 [Neoechinorhynchus agilis]
MKKTMRVIVQRVKSGSVFELGSRILSDNITQTKQLISKIDAGLVLFVGFTHTDTEVQVNKMAEKVLKLRVFENDKSKWSIGVREAGLEILSVSQFTLYAIMKCNKPDFHQSMQSDKAKRLYDLWLEKLKELYDPNRIKDGIFGKMMDVTIVNDGPVTLTLEY